MSLKDVQCKSTVLISILSRTHGFFLLFFTFWFSGSPSLQATCPASPDENYCSSHHYRNQKHHKHKKYTKSQHNTFRHSASISQSKLLPVAGLSRCEYFFCTGGLREASNSRALFCEACSNMLFGETVGIYDFEGSGKSRKCSVWFMSILKALYQFFLRAVVAIQQSDILASIYVSVQRKSPYRPVIGVLHASNHF